MRLFWEKLHKLFSIIVLNVLLPVSVALTIGLLIVLMNPTLNVGLDVTSVVSRIRGDRPLSSITELHNFICLMAVSYIGLIMWINEIKKINVRSLGINFNCHEIIFCVEPKNNTFEKESVVSYLRI